MMGEVLESCWPPHQAALLFEAGAPVPAAWELTKPCLKWPQDQGGGLFLRQ